MYKVTDAISNISSLASLQAMYWNMYMGVIFAFLAFLLNNWDKKKHPLPMLFLGVGMLLFFASNCRELALIQEHVNARRYAVHSYVLAHPSEIPIEFLAALGDAPASPPIWSVTALHVVVDACLLALLAYNYWYTTRKATAGDA